MSRLILKAPTLGDSKNNLIHKAMTPEEKTKIENQFAAVINATVGDESKATELSMSKTSVNFLVLSTAHDYKTTIQGNDVTFPAYLVGSMDGAVHYISQSTMESKALYEAVDFTQMGISTKFKEIRKIVEGFMAAKGDDWRNVAIEFEKAEVGYIFDTQSNEHKKSRVSLFKVRPMTETELEVANIVRQARAAKQV